MTYLIIAFSKREVELKSKLFHGAHNSPCKEYLIPAIKEQTFWWGPKNPYYLKHFVIKP